MGIIDNVEGYFCCLSISPIVGYPLLVERLKNIACLPYLFFFSVDGKHLHVCFCFVFVFDHLSEFYCSGLSYLLRPDVTIIIFLKPISFLWTLNKNIGCLIFFGLMSIIVFHWTGPLTILINPQAFWSVSCIYHSPINIYIFLYIYTYMYNNKENEESWTMCGSFFGFWIFFLLHFFLHF